MIERLRHAFDENGSDKGSKHGYHRLYPQITKEIGPPAKILEIGIGTQNKRFASNMSKGYAVGGSLRAWAEVFSTADIVGADVDSEILFFDKTIRCYELDQTSPESFRELGEKWEIASI